MVRSRSHAIKKSTTALSVLRLIACDSSPPVVPGNKADGKASNAAFSVFNVSAAELSERQTSNLLLLVAGKNGLVRQMGCDNLCFNSLIKICDYSGLIH